MVARVVAGLVLGPVLVAATVLAAGAGRPPLDLDRVDLLGVELAAGLALLASILVVRGLAADPDRVVTGGLRTGAVSAGIVVVGVLVSLGVAALTLDGVVLPGADGPGGVDTAGATPTAGAMTAPTDVFAPPAGDTLVVAVLLAVALLVVVATALALRRSRDPETTTATTSRQVRQAARHAEASMAAAAPHGARAAVLAAFATLEERLADDGRGRGAAETQDELVGRLLLAEDVDRAAVADLGDAYRVARWSTTSLPDALVDRARTALTRIGGGT